MHLHEHRHHIGYTAVIVLEALLGRTRHGSTLGLVIDLLHAILDRLKRKYFPEEKKDEPVPKGSDQGSI